MTAISQTIAASPARQRSSRLPLLAVGVVLAVAGAFVWKQHFATYHLETVQEGVLYRDGVQSMTEFANAVEKVRPKTVVSLIDDAEMADPKKPQFKQELTYLNEQGIRVERIPVKLGGWPTAADVEKFLKIATDPGSQPVLVHCAQGVRRTGMMVAAFQEAVLKYEDQKVRDAIITFGHSNRTVGDVQRFIDGYDPKTGAVPTSMPASKE